MSHRIVAGHRAPEQAVLQLVEPLNNSCKRIADDAKPKIVKHVVRAEEIAEADLIAMRMPALLEFSGFSTGLNR